MEGLDGVSGADIPGVNGAATAGVIGTPAAGVIGIDAPGVWGTECVTLSPKAAVGVEGMRFRLVLPVPARALGGVAGILDIPPD